MAFSVDSAYVIDNQYYPSATTGGKLNLRVRLCSDQSTEFGLVWGVVIPIPPWGNICPLVVRPCVPLLSLLLFLFQFLLCLCSLILPPLSVFPSF